MFVTPHSSRYRGAEIRYSRPTWGWSKMVIRNEFENNTRAETYNN